MIRVHTFARDLRRGWSSNFIPRPTLPSSLRWRGKRWRPPSLDDGRGIRVNDANRTDELLAQILEVQRAHLDEYKRVTSQSLALQRQGLDTQSRHVRLYKGVIVALAIV